MTNYEKYKEMILCYTASGGFAVNSYNGAVVPCSGDIHCEDCMFDKDVRTCNKEKLEWLNAEYKEHNCGNCERWTDVRDDWGSCFKFEEDKVAVAFATKRSQTCFNWVSKGDGKW